MAAATHIIGRQDIRLRYHGKTDVLALRSQVSRLCSDELPVRLNKLLDAYDETGFVLRIDKLDIQLAISDGGDLQETLAKAIIEKIEVALRQKLELRLNRALSVPHSFFAELRFYLEKGYLPWWSLAKDASGFRERLRQSWQLTLLEEVMPQLCPLLQSRPALDRLITLLDEEGVDAFILAAGNWTPDRWAEWKSVFEFFLQNMSGQSDASQVSRQLALAALRISISGIRENAATQQMAIRLLAIFKVRGLPIPVDVGGSVKSVEIRQALMQSAKMASTDGVIGERMQSESVEESLTDVPMTDQENVPEKDESIFVGNAGIVLLALYLPAFFERLEMLNAGRPENLPRAIALLRYLAYGGQAANDFQELEAVMEKLLCGIPLADGISERHVISDEEKLHCDELLQSVIEHWSVLKNTSPDGLRLNFLQRDGRLLFRNNQWELSVQKESHDILLNYLPWNINMIKLSWMPHLLYVKWNT